MSKTTDAFIEQFGDTPSKPIDISRTEPPRLAGAYRTDDAPRWPGPAENPIVWVATRMVAVVGLGNTSVMSRVVGVSRDRAVLEGLAAQDHTIMIEAVEIVR